MTDPEAEKNAEKNAAQNVVTRPTLGQLLGLAWPLIITRSSQVVVGFTDAAMCARLGEDALAATTAGATNAFNVIIFFMGTAFIVSCVVIGVAMLGAAFFFRLLGDQS